MRDSRQVMVRVGLPYLTGDQSHPFLTAVQDIGARTLISVGSLYRPHRGWLRASITSWTTGPALDSAGFTAMVKFGGYRWTVEEYVERIVMNFDTDQRDDGYSRALLPHPWAWWSAMDYCCEKEIAPNRAEVDRRISMTVDSYAETIEALEWWRGEGENVTPDPLPILQGRTPKDYIRCATALAEAIDRTSTCTCPGGKASDCGATWHRERAGLPELVGVGSVCTREATGREGILNVLAALDAELPKHVRLHLFGVKGELLQNPAFGSYVHRVASVDSSAWDDGARHGCNDRRRAGEQNVSADLAWRRQHLIDWYGKQSITPQLGLFNPRR